MNHSMKILTVLCIIMGITYGRTFGRKRSVNEMNAIAASVFTDGNTATRIISHDDDKNCIYPLLKRVSSSGITNVKSRIKNDEAFYIYTFQDGRPGYVIVSADDHLPEVLAFSDTEILDVEDLPNTMVKMLSDYATLLDGTVGVEEATNKTDEMQSSYTAESMEPLLGDIAFSQREPYNKKCPSYNGEKTLVGCVATALSQLMAYYHYPDRMEGDKIDYRTNTLQIPVTWDCKSTYFDWDNILDTYSQEVPEYGGGECATDTEYMIMTGMKESEEYKGYLEIYHFANDSKLTLDMTVQLVLTDENGNFIQPIGIQKNIKDLEHRYYYKTYYLKHSLPSELPDGNYRIYVGVKLDGTSEWSLVKKATDDNNIYNSKRTDSYIMVYKQENSYSIENEVYACGYKPIQADAISTLCAANGASALMDYTPSSSGANVLSARDALIEHMGYDKSIAYLNQDYFTQESWLEFIKNELLNGRPVYCSGHPEEGSGHAFIIDGFRELNNLSYFHVNWGWNGSSNGYFLINYLQPEEAGDGGDECNYGYNLNLLTGIEPDNGTDDGFTIGAKSISINFPSSPTEMKIRIDTLMNCSYRNFSGEILAYAVNEEHEIFLDYIFAYSNDWGPNTYFHTINSYLYLPTYIPNGNYKLQLRALEYDAETETDILSPHLPTFTFTAGTNSIVDIPTLTNNREETEIYDLLGRKIKEVKSKDIYIISGKKVIVK